MGISFNAASLLSGNGIDVNSVVSEIQAAQSGQVKAWQADQTTLQTQATAITSINTDLSNLASAVQGLSNGALAQLTANSSESAIVTGTAQSGATPANYSVVVKGLASTGTLYTDEVANATTSVLPSGQTTGNLTLLIGGKGGTTANIAITASNDTLTTLASSINSQSATNKWGITASVVTDATGARLAIYSQSTGSTGALSIPTGAGNNTTSLTFEPPIGGTDAEITINGIPYASSTNTVTGAIPDVTLTLVSADSATPVTLTVGPNTTAITNSIDNFVIGIQYGNRRHQHPVRRQSQHQHARTARPGHLPADPAIQPGSGPNLHDYRPDFRQQRIDEPGCAWHQHEQRRNSDREPIPDRYPDQLFPRILGCAHRQPQRGAEFLPEFQLDRVRRQLQRRPHQSYRPVGRHSEPGSGLEPEPAERLTTEITNFQTQLAAQKVQLDQEFDAVNTSLEEYPFTLYEVTAALGSLTVGGTATGTTPSTNTTPTAGESVSGAGNTDNTSSTSGS